MAGVGIMRLGAGGAPPAPSAPAAFCAAGPDREVRSRLGPARPGQQRTVFGSGAQVLGVARVVALFCGRSLGGFVFEVALNLRRRHAVVHASRWFRHDLCQAGESPFRKKAAANSQDAARRAVVWHGRASGYSWASNPGHVCPASGHRARVGSSRSNLHHTWANCVRIWQALVRCRPFGEGQWWPNLAQLRPSLPRSHPDFGRGLFRAKIHQRTA